MRDHSPDDPIWGDDPSDAEQPKQKKQKAGKFSVVSDHPFAIRRARCPVPASIPPRPWLFSTQLLRGFVSVLVAPGGTGKSLYAMAVGLCVALGQELMGFRVYQRTNCAYVNLEDPMDELERRLAALQIRYRLDPCEISEHFFMSSGDECGLTIAKVSDDGSEILHPDIERVINEINQNQIGLLIVDPYAESHELPENDNPAMVRAAKAWRTVARATGCAILLLHHVRKGAVADIDSARGAKALTDSARVGLLMAPMSSDEAAELGLPEEDAATYVRLDNAKANMSQRAGKATWFHLEQVALGNRTSVYPSGDHVAVVVPWTPPTTFGDLTVEECNLALSKIAVGPREGVKYAPNQSGRDNSRWCGNVLIEMFGKDRGVTEQRAAAIIATWFKNDVLRSEKYRDAEQRRERNGVVVNDAKRPGTEPEA